MTKDDRELESQAHAAERLARATLTGRERAELWERIAQSTSGSGAFVRALRRKAARGAWVAVPALAALGLWLGVKPDAPEAAQQIAKPAASACTLDASAAAFKLPAHCAPSEVRIAGDDWRLERGVEVLRIEHGAHVKQGRVQFRVKPRKAAGAAPFRVRVSHAELFVIGTVFVVEQRADGGSVYVSEGAIELVWRDGTRERVSAGQSAHWPRVPREEPLEQSASQGPERLRATPEPVPAPDLEAVLERLLQMRSQERYPEAVRLLRETLARPALSSVQRERISYELGLALEASDRADPRAGCEHWRAHIARFGTKRHEAALDERLARCKER